jgi:mRNA interferase MazF
VHQRGGPITHGQQRRDLLGAHSSWQRPPGAGRLEYPGGQVPVEQACTQRPPQQASDRIDDVRTRNHAVRGTTFSDIGVDHRGNGRFFDLPGRGSGRKLSAWIVAFTSTSARPTSFRPQMAIGEQQTLVMCDQLATVDLNRLTEPIGFLTIDEMERVDNALAVVLDL